jgi:hypothetical protein
MPSKLISHMKTPKNKKRVLLYVGIGIIFSIFAVGVFTFYWFAYRVIDSYFFTPACSERYYETVAYSDTYSFDVVTPEEIDSGEYCAAIKNMDDQDRTDCAVQWIDKEAQIAYVKVHLKVDCRYQNQTGPDRYFKGIIVRGAVVPVERYEEAIESPKSSGKYIEYLHLTEGEITMINAYLENLEKK